MLLIPIRNIPPKFCWGVGAQLLCGVGENIAKPRCVWRLLALLETLTRVSRGRPAPPGPE